MSKLHDNSYKIKLILFYTVIADSEYNQRVRGSKFFGLLFPAASAGDIEKKLSQIRSEHPSATHHCYAYIINPQNPEEFSADNGEPSGTAGLPILNSLRSHQLINVILVVVRHYGGTKLGKAGLIEAYAETAAGVIQHARLKKLHPVQLYKITYDYSRQNIIDKLKNDFSIIEIESEYKENVRLHIACPQNEAVLIEAAVAPVRHLLIRFESNGESYHVEK